MRHPTQTELKAYRRRELPAASMLALDDHVAACEQCRRLLNECEPMADSAGVLAQLGEPHLTYEAIERYVDERAGRNERVRLDGHLERCRQCREELADLRDFRRSLAKTPAARLPALQVRWLLAAAAILVVAGAALWWNAQHRSPDFVTLALATGELNIPEPVLALRGARSVVRGPESGAGFALLGPMGTAVIGDRPRFTWKPLAGAGAYRVAIFTPGFRKVAESPWLESTGWTPLEPLERSQVYSWQVTARMGAAEDARTLRAPDLTDPEAKFQVIAATEALDLERTRREHPASHLLLGVIYARAGVLDLAEQELALYAAANPKSAQAAALLEKLRALRR